jgi:hypothetical protein
MYIPVTRARMDPARLDEVASQVAQDVAAAIRRLPGWQSSLGGADRASGRTVTVSTGDTEDHARWSPAQALGDIPSRLQALGVQVDPSEIFEMTTTYGVVQAPGREAILRLRAWLADAELPDPPLVLMPGVEAYDVELLRRRLLAATALGDDGTALLHLRYLAARYGPPELAALARPEQLPRPPRRRQL